jgi:hypothetical protein
VIGRVEKVYAMREFILRRARRERLAEALGNGTATETLIAQRFIGRIVTTDYAKT